MIVQLQGTRNPRLRRVADVRRISYMKSTFSKRPVENVTAYIEASCARLGDMKWLWPTIGQHLCMARIWTSKILSGLRRFKYVL